MNKTTAGYTVFVAAIGMMFGLMAVDISQINMWGEISTPGFVASILGHIGVVITAFVGGKLIPENRNNNHSRHSDRQNRKGENDKEERE